jgi:hypothetical protein
MFKVAILLFTVLVVAHQASAALPISWGKCIDSPVIKDFDPSRVSCIKILQFLR